MNDLSHAGNYDKSRVLTRMAHLRAVSFTVIFWVLDPNPITLLKDLLILNKTDGLISRRCVFKYPSFWIENGKKLNPRIAANESSHFDSFEHQSQE